MILEFMGQVRLGITHAELWSEDVVESGAI